MYKRDADLIEDDIYALVQNKIALIDVLANAKKLISDNAFDEHAITVEQEFDDMMCKAFHDLLDESIIHVEWPKSAWYAAWLDKRDRRVATNPATYEAKGESL